MLKSKNSKLKREGSFSEQWPMAVMLAPFLLMFIIFTVIPIFGSVVLSFTKYDTLTTPAFIGFENYKRMFLTDSVFTIVVKNTLVLAIISGPIGFLLSFILAWFVNEFSPIVRTFLSFLFFAPSLVGNAFFVWKILFSGDSFGYINNILLSIGVITEPIIWLKTADYVVPIILIVQLWQSTGVSFLANISGLQNVSRDLYEAGAIDGIKNRWQELRYITLPTMKSMLLFSAVMQIQSSFSISAIATEMVGYPSVRYSGDTIVSYMMDVGTVRYEMGYAASIAVVLFVIMALTRMLVGKALATVSR